MRIVSDIDITGKTIFMRTDFNVPIDENGNITDDLRIMATLPTIKYIINQKAKVILCSHMDRPKGKPNPDFSLKPVANALSKILNIDVIFSDDDEVIGEKTIDLVETFKKSDDQVMLLQNIRFRKEEEENDQKFAKQLAGLADIFVMDAFGAAHRAHASTVGIAGYLPSYSGFLMEKEVGFLQRILTDPQHPFTIVMGGKKVSDKIGIIEHFLGKADHILVGGAMAFTFLSAQGYDMGESLVEEEEIQTTIDMLNKSKASKTTIHLPVDIVGSTEFSNDTPKFTYTIENIPSDFIGMDIGEKTINIFSEILLSSASVVMNGPMGVFEMSNYEEGTKKIIQAIADIKDGTTIIGGGDSAAAVKKFGMQNKMTHISTGGGASLQFLEGKVLPGVKALEGEVCVKM